MVQNQIDDRMIQQLMTDQHIPGVALGILRGNTLLHEGYYGSANLEYDVPVHAQTVFELASVTKLFTTQALIRLLQQGRITLETALSAYLPDLPGAWQAVTIRHCLTHQSGLPDYTASATYWQQTRTAKSPAEVIDLVRDLPLQFPSGSKYYYDNTGFYLLGLVIEAVTGQSYAEHLRQAIFEPLGMVQTQANDYDRIILHRAQGYRYQDGQIRNKPFYNTSNTFSAGIVVSSVRDLIRWRASVFDDSILTADSRRLWWTLQPSTSANERQLGFTLGLGWFRLDSPAGTFWGHNGGIAGFASSFVYFPDTDVTSIVLCNSDHVTEPHAIGFALLGANGLIK